MRPGLEPREVVLVGGGHAHVQVLRSWSMAPVPGVQLTLVADRGTAVYSGMVPGFVAGDYSLEEISIDLARLAARAGAQLIQTSALTIEPELRRLSLADRPPIFYDVASLDVGSRVLGWRLPGVERYALTTRPIATLTQGLHRRFQKLESGQSVCIVGGGAGGVELAFCCRFMLDELGIAASVRLIDSSAQILSGYPESLRQRVLGHARTRGIELSLGLNVVEVEADAVKLETGARLSASLVLWVGGAAPPALIEDSRLPSDPRGFVQCDDQLRVSGYTELFAVGDCAVQSSHPWVPRAGVYAVRQGPVLDHNLRAVLEGGTLKSYEPQRDYLSLLNLGGGMALGSKWGRTLEGRWVWHLKDRIDRRFVARFTFDDTPADERDPNRSATDAGASSVSMECGGCAAKLQREVLQEALGELSSPVDAGVVWGIAEAEDVAAWKIEGDVIVANLDAFSAFSRDYYTLGRVAATNALSDLWAKAARPEVALASLVVPEAPRERQARAVAQLLQGARRVFDQHAVRLLGGHTQRGERLNVGFAVWGRADGRLLPKRGVQVGDSLILTKPLGSGVLLHGDAVGECRSSWRSSLYDVLLTPNSDAGRIAQASGASAATDVTGFGLLGHLLEMLEEDRFGAELDLAALPALPGALELLGRGYRSTFHGQNAVGRRRCRVAPEVTEAGRARTELLFDPQTSGGLLIAVPQADSARLLQALQAAGLTRASKIGRVTAPGILLV